MTTLQKITLRLSEVRTRLNEISGLEGEALTGEVTAESDTLQTEYKDLETRHRAAITASPDPEPQPVETEDAEDRERRELREKVGVSDHLAAALEGRPLDGAAAEYNPALGLRANGAFPLELLAPAVEQRAVTITDTAVHARPWLDRLFADTAAARLGITFESVQPGVASYPVITAGSSPAQRGKGQAAADAPWTVGVSELKPTRNAVRAVFSEEDSMRLPGLEEALRRDLSMALTEKIDRTIFKGDSTANPANGDISGLDSLSDVVEKEITQANKIKGPETMTAFLPNWWTANTPMVLRICGLWLPWVRTLVAGYENQRQQCGNSDHGAFPAGVRAPLDDPGRDRGEHHKRQVWGIPGPGPWSPGGRNCCCME